MKLSTLTIQHKNWLDNSEAGGQIDLKSLTLDAEQIRTAVLEGAIFDYITFERLEAFDCDFTGASFFNCTFISCKLIHCNFHKAEFHDCRFDHIQITGCSFTKSEWHRGEFRLAVFASCDFSWSYLQSVDLRHTHFNDINLEGAIWDRNKLYKASFKSITLGSLHTARIERTDFSQDGNGGTWLTFEQFREVFRI